ncbi:hypothetical protein [Asanoa sp. NPDC050611]|uniref:hypothetical protein n=1 Tax=Asanoa sp. NPDC050611 TaxID=3157098 RepID=UPI0033E3BF91
MKIAPPPRATTGSDPVRAVIQVAVVGAREAAVQEVATVPSGGPSAPGTGGGDGGNDPRSTGMAVGTVLLVGVGLIAAAVALVGLRNRRDVVEKNHHP